MVAIYQVKLTPQEVMVSTAVEWTVSVMAGAAATRPAKRAEATTAKRILIDVGGFGFGVWLKSRDGWKKGGELVIKECSDSWFG